MSVGASVAVPVPVRRLFTYRVPDELRDSLRPGSRVLVPFGSRQLTGFVVSPAEVDPENDRGLKSIVRVLDPEPLVSESMLRLAGDMARRYLCSMGEVLAAFLPAGVKRGARGKRTAIVTAVMPKAAEALAVWPAGDRQRKQRDVLSAVVEAEATGIPRQTLLRVTRTSDSPLKTLERKGLVRVRLTTSREDVLERLDVSASRPPALTPAQTRAVDALRAAIQGADHTSFLLHGVTGSGKTEVYLAAIEDTLAGGRGAIVLVPEIALTPQTVERFASRFGSVAVLHSHLTDAERAHQWEALRSGERRIAIGPRSALFAPVRELGLIVLDEEHESTFKQQNVPRYHARDVALMRGRIERAVVILGSATPSLETLDAARRGRTTVLSMPERVGGAPLPQVSIIDMRSQRPMGPGGLLSPILTNMVRRTLDRGEQALLFLNRRGFNTALLCKGCGYVMPCRDCDIPMTYYRTTNSLLCHYCHRRATPPRHCPECRHEDIYFRGFGTEAVEHAARRLFPQARLARMDGESMRHRHAHEEMFARLKAGEIDILVGTQMVAKGLDFPGITLIGVVSGDTSLLIPDFRAAERTFQLMTQVAGRSGRGQTPGRVFIQTYCPEHYSFRCAAAHDVEGFAAQELAYRAEARYPPYGVLVRIIAQGRDETKVHGRMERIAESLREPSRARGVTLLGPGPAPIAYLKKLHRRHLVLRADHGEDLEAILDGLERELRNDAAVQVLVDRDPTSMM